MNFIKSITVIFLTFSSSNLYAASFDCTKANTAVEKMICQNSKLNKLDDRLAEIYREVRKIDQSIVEDQRAWLRQTRTCNDEICLEKAYSERISDLEKKLTKVGQSKNEVLSINDDKQVLNILFSTGGFWATDDKINKSNLSCNSVLSGPNPMGVLKKYEPTVMSIYLRLPQGMREIRVPIYFENIKVNGNLITFDRFEKSSNGALLGGTYQLDIAQKSLRQLRSHTCQNCAESQIRIHNKNLNGSTLIEYWCTGSY